MVAQNALPKQGAVPNPPLSWSTSSVSAVVKTAPRRLPSVGMRHPSLLAHADKKIVQHHHYTSFRRASPDSPELDIPRQESRGDQLRKQIDPRG
mmetsp:Transcript_62825/g.149669  ORF Transcript_62825/g.149669 Transcript_62825/m.149669 type:complete len:94 (-) Transcript_62825:766-1047(-)